MPVHLTATDPAQLLPVVGVRPGVAQAGIRKAGRDDLTVLLLDDGASVGGVFTQNRFCAAPVQVCREHLAGGAPIRAIVINTGNANAGTGEDGLARARQTCAALAGLLNIEANQVLPLSTGVIMEPLPVDRIAAGLPAALAAAGVDQWGRAASAIMTTDTVPKAFSAKARVGGVEVAVDRSQRAVLARLAALAGLQVVIDVGTFPGIEPAGHADGSQRGRRALVVEPVLGEHRGHRAQLLGGLALQRAVTVALPHRQRQRQQHAQQTDDQHQLDQRQPGLAA